jgi:DMSO/TMAO reductase YedYZ molybdopterin-dependent catalytic subunit
MVRPADVVTGVEERFESPLHETRTAAILGIALGVTFGACFATGLLSHLIQHPPGWFRWPSRPAGLYRATQGVHVTTGFVSIPILLAKLWTVFPRFWTWPPARNVAHAVERVTLLPLVAGAVFLLYSGVANVARFYPYPFFFPAAHYWVAWMTIGAMVAHVGAKAAVTRDALRRPTVADGAGETLPASARPVDRRAFLTGVAATSVALGLATAGSTVGPLSSLAVLGQRRPGFGPQGLPVNKTARGAGVVASARRPSYRLVVEGDVDERFELTLAQLEALPQRRVVLPIACVEGWSTSAHWTGVPVRDLLVRAGAPAGASVVVESLERNGRYRSSLLDPSHAHDRDTLLATRIGGEPLDIDHGYPVRLIGPNRPGVMQTKWVERLVVRR